MLKTESALPRRKRNRLRKYIPLYLMMIPGLLYLIINNYIPMSGLFIAFKRINFSVGIFKSEWVGLSNFRYLFSTSDAWQITRNTILYNIAFIACNTVLAVTMALILSELSCNGARRVYQSIVLLPYLISMVVVSYIAQAFLHSSYGFINKILKSFGVSPVSWYTEAKRWPYILIFINSWKNVGYLSVIYYAAVIGVDRECLEAAEIEGAGKLRQITAIIVPLISPVIITMVLLAVGRIFYSDFGLFYHVPMNTGLLYSATNTIDTYVYRGLMQQNNVGMSAAAGLYQSVVGFIVVLLANLLVRHTSPDNALF